MRESPDPSTSPGHNSQDPSERRGLSLVWVVPDQRTQRLFERDRWVVGRGEDADFVVGGNQASRHHAEIRRDGPLWIVADRGSTNGTFVNGQRVAQAPLGPRTVLRIGDAVAVAALEPEQEPLRPFREVSPGFFAGSELQRGLDRARAAAQSELPMVIEGETGAGKERLANWIHLESRRAGALVALNCAALPESLAEAELFGYRKGAFTGAVQANLGHFRAAQGGTLLLDEIVDLPLALQAKLLRAIEQREVTPLGEANPVVVDVRILAASQEPLEAAVKARKFRGDLWARLDGFTVRLPSLRERAEDIAPLFLRFLSNRCGGHPPSVDARLIEALCLYEWPYNVRELELLALRMAVVHGHEPALRRSLLPHRFAAAPAATAPALHLDEPDEYSRFVKLLRAHGGVVARAAEAAGISRMRAYRLMKENDLDPDSLRGPDGGER